MARLDLQQPWLLDLADKENALPVLLLGMDRSFSHSVPGQVRRYAGGARRAVRNAGVDRGVKLTISVPAGLKDRILTMTGRTVLYRDGLGSRIFGTFFDAGHEPSMDGLRYVFTLNLTAVSYVEAV